MNPSNDPDDPREQDLAALFEKSATSPSELEHARLLRRAAEVAEQRLSARRFTARVAWPGAIAAAAAAFYLVVAPPRGAAPTSPAVRVVNPTTRVVAGPAPMRSANGPAAVVAEAVDEGEDPVASMLGSEPGDTEPLDLGLLMGAEDRGSEH